jgi:hypothetical protein
MTVVELLVQKIKDKTIYKTHLNDEISEWQDGYNVALEEINKLLTQALEMEKQQTLHFWNAALWAAELGGNFKEYYENYKKDNL